MIEFNNIVHGFKIAAAIPRPYNPAVDVVISHVTLEGNCMGGVIYDGFTGGNIFMHQAGFHKRWLGGNMLWIVFDYPFNQLKVRKVAGTINSSNKELLDFNRRLGFKEEARIKGAYPNGDLLVLTMERAECRWLKLRPKIAKDAMT
jgi:RimJ/RimL family protein N-acetyltransferase